VTRTTQSRDSLRLGRSSFISGTRPGEPDQVVTYPRSRPGLSWTCSLFDSRAAAPVIAEPRDTRHPDRGRRAAVAEL